MFWGSHIVGLIYVFYMSEFFFGVYVYAPSSAVSGGADTQASTGLMPL